MTHMAFTRVIHINVSDSHLEKEDHEPPVHHPTEESRAVEGRRQQDYNTDPSSPQTNWLFSDATSDIMFGLEMPHEAESEHASGHNAVVAPQLAAESDYMHV
ncbi:hypothetical protein NDU88_006847 [Pleurodeles waltl]|uniref:Uncharacterized protein n=1 Tax=Pleurodeles waltl TaxID=8319 RepID=A0AAV7PMK6_PLEWA|nr:hypothetical protein NDU88_006847 [Pleurodeles waltl]